MSSLHPDDLAVDRFAAAMKVKLAQKRAEGRGGWDRKDECTAEFLSELLRGHVEKGEPVDVGNFAMMLHQRGERIAVDHLNAAAPALLSALRFILAFYEPGQTHLDTEAWKVAEASARAAVAKAEGRRP